MSPAGKIAGLGILFALIFISPAGAEPLLDEATPLSLEDYLLSDEFILSEEFQEFLLDEELFLGEDPFLDEESLVNEDHVFDDGLLAEELLAGEAPPSDEGSLVSEDPVFDEEILLSEDFLSDEELLLSEGSLIFEAPPLVFEVSPVYESRSFDDIFPGFSQGLKTIIFSDRGLKHSFGRDSSPLLTPDPAAGVDLLSSVMAKNPSHIIELLTVVPYNERELDMLDVYNALGRIENIKDHSIPFNDRDYFVFSETTRLVSAKNRKSVSDPPPADTLPYSETMYLRFKEVSIGNVFLRGDISISLYGITYSMTNFTDVRYFILPVMKAERFSAVIYLEPVKEGVLVYCMSGLYLPGFIADRINLTPSINNRIGVLVSWVTDGLRRQENRLAEREPEAASQTAPAASLALDNG